MPVFKLEFDEKFICSFLASKLFLHTRFSSVQWLNIRKFYIRFCVFINNEESILIHPAVDDGFSETTGIFFNYTMSDD